jgi:DNA replication protein DnaC
LAKEAKALSEYRQIEKRGRLLRAGFGNRHIDCEVARFVPADAGRKTWEAVKAGSCVALVGESGRGKTQLACELCRAWIARNAEGQPLYVTAARMMEVLKRSWGGEGADPRDAWRKTPLLVIDDLHLRYNRETWEIEVGDLLDSRYYDAKATVLIANLTESDFTKSVGVRIASRINQGGGIFEVRGEDRRLANGGAA